jgi:hypothetical protein
MRGHGNWMLEPVSVAIIGATLTSWGEIYVAAEHPRDLDHAQGERPVNLVVRCEGAEQGCDYVKSVVRSTVLDSAVFTDISSAENLSRLEVTLDRHETNRVFTALPCLVLSVSTFTALGCTTEFEYLSKMTFKPAGGSPVHKEYRQTIYIHFGLCGTCLATSSETDC